MEIEQTFICLHPINKVFIKVYIGSVLTAEGIIKMYFMEYKNKIEEIDELYFKSIKKINNQKTK